jgi:hypothetical protein
MAALIDRSLRLSDDQYFPAKTSKSGICLHHTVGGSAVSTFNWWQQSPAPVGTAYIVERDGKIHEVFDPECWAWQFGLKWNIEEKAAFEKRFIGIEIASEGGLLEKDGKLYCFDRVDERTLKNPEEAFDYGRDYRGYRYFDRYEPKQIDSVVDLVNDLCARFNIEKNVPADYLGFHGKKLGGFQGVIGHVNVRMDKSDPAPDADFWEKVIGGCGLSKVATFDEVEELFDHNVAEFSKMNRNAAAVIKGVLYELQRDGRNTYIKLHDAQPGGHVVRYKMVQGDPDLVRRIGGALGLKSVTADTLEVFGG